MKNEKPNLYEPIHLKKLGLQIKKRIEKKEIENKKLLKKIKKVFHF